MKIVLGLIDQGITRFGDKVWREVHAAHPGFSRSSMHHARRVALTDRALADKVARNEISLGLASELVTKGERVTCPTCAGEGYIHRPRGLTSTKPVK
jgi:hypothetical protein